jgi:hypothetical protein
MHSGTKRNVSVTEDRAGAHQSSNQALDRETSRSICDAIGARLQRDLRTLSPSARLEQLIEEMRRREAVDRAN